MSTNQGSLFFPKQLANTEFFASKQITAYRPGGRLLTPEVALRENLDAYWAIHLDPAIRQSIEVMSRNIVGKTWKLEPASSEKPDRDLAKLLTEKLEEIRFFTRSRMAMAKEIAILGETYAFVNGTRKYLNLNQKGFQHYWIPTEIIHIDRNAIRKINNDDGSYYYLLFDPINRKWNEMDENQKQALIYINNSAESGRFTFGNGLLDPLYVIYTFKQNLLANLLSLAERFGEGFIELGIDGEVSSNEGDEVRTLQALNDTYAELLSDIKARKAFIKRKNDELKIHDPSSTGYQVIKEGIDYFDGLHRMLLIGSQLTVTQGAQGQGSYSLGFIHQDSEFNNARYPRILIDEGLTHHLVRLVWKLNKPQYDSIGLGEARHPRFFTPETRDDNPEANAIRLEKAQALGLDLVKSEAYHLLQLTQPTDEDEVIKPPLQSLPSPVEPFEPVETQALVALPKSGSGNGVQGEVSELSQNNSELPSEQFTEESQEEIPDGFEMMNPKKFASQKLKDFYEKPTRSNKATALRAVEFANKVQQQNPIQNAQQFAQESLKQFNANPTPERKLVALNAMEFAEQMEALCRK